MSKIYFVILKISLLSVLNTSIFFDNLTLGDCSCRHFTTDKGDNNCKTSKGQTPACIVKKPTTCSDIDNKDSGRQLGYSVEACKKLNGNFL